MSANKRGTLKFFVLAASTWAFLFAAMSFYWALGGTLGTESLGDITEIANSKLFMAIVWLTGILKVVAGLFALSLLYKWGAYIPKWIRLSAVATTGAICFLYGLANIAARAIMALGIIPTPPAMHSTAAQWHLFFWDPWWILGGILFLGAAWKYRRQTRLHQIIK